MNKYSELHYLVIRPLSEDSSDLSPHIEELTDITGMNATTIKQRFTGSALQILKTDLNKDILLDMAGDLKKAGIPTAVIAKSELKAHPGYFGCTSIEINDKSLYLFSKHISEPQRLDGSKSTIIVITSAAYESVQGKRLTRAAVNASGQLSVEPLEINEMLKQILISHPVIDIYISGSEIPIRINSKKFNYNSLGENNKGSSMLNIRFIIEEIKKHSTDVLIDIGYGENKFPFSSDFSTYSRFVFLASAMKIFSPTTLGTALTSLPLIKEFGGVLWGGPIFTQGNPNKKKPDPRDDSEAVLPRKLPTPPKGAIVYRYNNISSWGNWFRNFSHSYKRYIKSLGPAVIFYPLTALAFSSFILAYYAGRFEPLAVGVPLMGIILFIHSFVLLRRKRLIENCPTSKIKTMPMGEVEVEGTARPKFLMKSPFSFTDCVYYSYKVYTMVRTRNGTRQVLKEWGHSGYIPFYLEDESSSVLITPSDAIMRAGRTETVHGNMLTRIFGANSAFSNPNRRVVETVIPTGEHLYVMGFAKRQLISTELKRQTFMERLRALKQDKTQLMKYDTDGDGRIDAEEWDAARNDIEDKLLAESLSKTGSKDDIVIGEHPAGGLFYISDKPEAHILGSLSWRVPTFFTLGIAATAGGAFYLLQLAENDAILSELRQLLALIL
jgi:hypothetical protein